MSFNIGENIGPYRIVEQLGQGGMATVYKAYHASLDRYVALKALHPVFNEDKTFATRFQREARVVAKLEHPNIVPVYDYAEHENRPYLVMKYIEGDTLKARMTESLLSSGEVQNVVDAVGAALAYAHRQGILHRDIKPSNVLLATDGQIYLADFGLARIAQSGESTLSSDSIMGTPQYISPEQAMGKKDLDARTDLYSFGVMLYEISVGQVPFSADTPFAIIHDHIYTPMPLPRAVNPDVPEAVERVLLKALAKERDDRYEDANAMVRAFKEAWNEAPIPKQEAPIMVAPPITPEVKTMAASAPTKVAIQAKVAEAGSKPALSEVEASKAKRDPVVWIGAALIILLCLGALVFARNNRLFGRLRAGLSNPTPVAATQIQQPLATQLALNPTPLPTQAPPTQQVENTLPPPPNGNPPLDIHEAQQRADANPNDPNAQLDLALAFWNANMFKQTYDTLPRILGAAGPDNRDFYMQAGDKFKSQREGWLPAALLYFPAVRSYSSGDTPNHVTEAFHEALYKGANRPEFPMVARLDQMKQVSGPIVLIAQARHALFAGRMEEAVNLHNQATRSEDTLREASLVEGEYALRVRDVDKAKSILTALVEDTTSTPEWIRVFAQQLLDGMPK